MLVHYQDAGARADGNVLFFAAESTPPPSPQRCPSASAMRSQLWRVQKPAPDETGSVLAGAVKAAVGCTRPKNCITAEVERRAGWPSPAVTKKIAKSNARGRSAANLCKGFQTRLFDVIVPCFTELDTLFQEEGRWRRRLWRRREWPR